MSKVLDMWAGLTGTVFDFAGSAAPSGWLLCYGQAVSRTTYAQLFSVIGTTFGTGDGSTTFNLPDCRGRVHAGKDDMGGTAASRLTNAGGGITGTTLGAAGGAETHTLTAAEIPAHTHPIAAAGGGTVAGANQQFYQGINTGTTATSANTGGGSAHPITQPTIVFNKIIKT